MLRKIDVSGPVVLCILDGWGFLKEIDEGNAIRLSHAPYWFQMLDRHPLALLDASAGFVGLPQGQVGNSEVGHMTMGAGRIIEHDLVRISRELEEGVLYEEPTVLSLLQCLKKSGGTLHCMGLLSQGGVHSHIDHIKKFVQYFLSQGIPVFMHVISDGRDTDPMCIQESLDDFLSACPEAVIQSISGRFYAMDRDKNWDRTVIAYQAYQGSHASCFDDVHDYVKKQYAQGITDEFIEPAHAEGYRGITDSDILVTLNFRKDRMRQLVSLCMEGCGSVASAPQKIVTLTDYFSQSFPYIEPIVRKMCLEETLGEVVSLNQKRQLRIAETEKYAHVTFFFNGGRETPYKGEDRVLIPSLKIPNYRMWPRMSAQELTDIIVAKVYGCDYDLIIANYANPDMVGHTGDFSAALQAVKFVDGCLRRLEEAVLAMGGSLIITSDHGNIECMYQPGTRKPCKSHTLNKVPFMLLSKQSHVLHSQGILSDVAPTVLDLLGLPVPTSMTGSSLLKH